MRRRLIDERYQPPKSREARRSWKALGRRYGPKDKRLQKGFDRRKRKGWFEFEISGVGPGVAELLLVERAVK